VSFYRRVLVVMTPTCKLSHTHLDTAPSLLSKPSVASTLCDRRTRADSVSKCSAASGSRVARIKAGLKRGWYASGVGASQLAAEVEAQGPAWSSQQLFLSPQYLGLIRGSRDTTVNGVVYPVTRSQLAKQDQREAGYERTQIPWEAVTLLDIGPGTLETPDKSLPLYAYVVMEGRETLPGPATPIAQSYVDIFLGGALDIDAEVRFADSSYSFTAEVIATTYGWSSHWVNDRILPYRAHAHNPQTPAIDRALLKHVPPQHLQGIRLPQWPLPIQSTGDPSRADPGLASGEVRDTVHHQHGYRRQQDNDQPPRINRHQVAPQQ